MSRIRAARRSAVIALALAAPLALATAPAASAAPAAKAAQSAPQQAGETVWCQYRAHTDSWTLNLDYARDEHIYAGTIVNSIKGQGPGYWYSYIPVLGKFGYVDRLTLTRTSGQCWT